MVLNDRSVKELPTSGAWTSRVKRSGPTCASAAPPLRRPLHVRRPARPAASSPPGRPARLRRPARRGVQPAKPPGDRERGRPNERSNTPSARPNPPPYATRRTHHERTTIGQQSGPVRTGTPALRSAACNWIRHPEAAGMLSVARSQRVRRHEIARTLADAHDGVVTRADLRAAGVTRADPRRGRAERLAPGRLAHAQHRRGRTARTGTLVAGAVESGRHAVLDGATALQASGLTGWREDVIHISVRATGGHARWPASSIITCAGSEVLRAANSAAPAQPSPLFGPLNGPRLTAKPRRWWRCPSSSGSPGPTMCSLRWQSVLHTNRRTLLDAVIRDVCDGAHSMSELDFAQMCRDRGLPRALTSGGPHGRTRPRLPGRPLGASASTWRSRRPTRQCLGDRRRRAAVQLAATRRGHQQFPGACPRVEAVSRQVP